MDVNDNVYVEKFVNNIVTYLREQILTQPDFFLHFERFDEFEKCLLAVFCNSGSHKYASPSLWKAFSFNLFVIKAKIFVSQKRKFKRRFGCSFRHIASEGKEIMKHKRLKREVVNKAYLQIQSFLKVISLSNHQFLSIQLKLMCKNPNFFNETEYSNLYQNVFNMMSTQKHLQRIEFHKCSFKLKDGVYLLRIICESNAETLKYLDLRRFIRDEHDYAQSNPDLILQYRILSHCLLDLKCLEMDYSKFFENILYSLYDEMSLNQKTKKLSSLKLHCNGSEEGPVKGIPPVVWQHLRKMCPKSEVDITLTYTYWIRNYFKFYLVEHIHLVSLNVLMKDVEHSEDVVMGDLFQQLYSSNLTQHLEELSIVWMPTVDNVSTDLIPFLRACRKLVTFDIFLRYPVSGIRELLEFIFQSHPVSLEEVFISISRIMDEADRCSLMLLADYYSHIFKRIGLKLILLTDDL